VKRLRVGSPGVEWSDIGYLGESFYQRQICAWPVKFTHAAFALQCYLQCRSREVATNHSLLWPLF